MSQSKVYGAPQLQYQTKSREEPGMVTLRVPGKAVHCTEDVTLYVKGNSNENIIYSKVHLLSTFSCECYLQEHSSMCNSAHFVTQIMMLNAANDMLNLLILLTSIKIRVVLECG